ncbi:hypothetical protein MLD38_022264 [Melastoma candidum]|uniref:Uncharacterized protein n=1 Tax=Melastoma candidum TaxID=119954 RepID=A0ACB9QML1_9MYRT|nr:hypothetical protein MLD38_022264 [Melastoma candidum]
MKLVCGGWRRFLWCLPLLFIVSHLLSGGLRPDLSIEEVPKKGKNKFDRLVLGPATGQGLPNRLHCQGVKALNRTRYSSSRPRAEARERTTFVTVFTIYNGSLDVRGSGGSSDRVVVGRSSYNRVERSMAILTVFFNFIQVTMPQSDVVILTDPASDLSVTREGVFVHPIEGEYSRDKLMLQRIRSYIAFLDEEQRNVSPDQIHNYIFTDSDIAVVDDLNSVFRDFQDFHLALTFRNNKNQPLNSGFIAVRGTPEGINRARMFLKEVLEAYISRYSSASRMLGDQLALAWVVKFHASFDLKRFTKPQAFVEKVGGASVLFLPCAVYNWTPPEGAGQFHGMPLDVKVVHFKGSRKRLMLESWNYYNSSGSMADMLCLILGSGRTKYDF